jgi:hypothetical protein
MDKCPVVFLSSRRPTGKPKGTSLNPSLSAAMTDGVMSFPRERRQAKIYDFGKAVADHLLRRELDLLELELSAGDSESDPRDK